MNFEEIEIKAIVRMREMGLDAARWKFRWIRSCRRFGQCRFPWVDLTGTLRQLGHIELSRPLCEVNSWEETLDTINHEIAHALAGPEGRLHNDKWLAMCKVTGCRPQACGYDKVPVPARYQAKCECCGIVHQRYKKPDPKMQYNCKKCGPTFGKVKFLDMQLMPQFS